MNLRQDREMAAYPDYIKKIEECTKELQKMDDDLNGWELYNESCYEVSLPDSREIIVHKTYIKEIDGKWYYKDVKEVTPLKLRIIFPCDVNRDPIYDWIEVK